MSSATPLLSLPDSGLDEWVDGLRWFWKVGSDRPAGSAPIGFGRAADADSALRSVASGELAGAVLFASAGDAGGDLVPAATSAEGIAKFDRGSVRGSFTVLESARSSAVLRSNLGIHAATIEKGVMVVGASPAENWGRLDDYWVYPLLVEFVADQLRAPVLGMPPVGALRLDDIPGNAQQQLEERDQRDKQQRRRIASWIPVYEKHGSVLNIAVPAQALTPQRERVPLDTIWPQAIDAMGVGMRSGAFEPVCHGLLHLDTEELAAGRIEFREFGRLGRQEARERIEAGIEWQTRHLAKPPTFVAPAWIYGAHGLDAAGELGIPAWLKPGPGPMVEGGNVHETLIDGPPGHNRLDYRPLSALANAGIPPTVIFHGTLLDGRMGRLDVPRDLPTMAGLFLRRDIYRLPAVPDIRWIGAGELFARAIAHDGRAADETATAAAVRSAELVELARPESR